MHERPQRHFGTLPSKRHRRRENFDSVATRSTLEARCGTLSVANTVGMMKIKCQCREFFVRRNRLFRLEEPSTIKTWRRTRKRPTGTFVACGDADNVSLRTNRQLAVKTFLLLVARAPVPDTDATKYWASFTT